MLYYFIGMSINKRLKPNLIDPIIGQKIIKTLKPPREDYWEPTRNVAKSFYHDYIKPNFGLVILIIVIIILLIYRYRVIKNERESKLLQNPMAKIDGNQNNSDKNNSDKNGCDKNGCDKNGCKNQKNVDPNIEEYSKLLLEYYNQQKENLREPKIKNFNNRIQPAKQGPKLAYPMYAYVPGGSLAPSGNRA